MRYSCLGSLDGSKLPILTATPEEGRAEADPGDNAPANMESSTPITMRQQNVPGGHHLGISMKQAETLSTMLHQLSSNKDICAYSSKHTDFPRWLAQFQSQLSNQRIKLCIGGNIPCPTRAANYDADGELDDPALGAGVAICIQSLEEQT